MSVDRFVLVTVSVRGTVSADGVDARGNQFSLSTYGGLPEFVERHGAEVDPAAVVVDLTPLASHPELMRLVWRAPMCHPQLTDDGSGWELAGGLDYVSPAGAGRYWAAQGAKVSTWAEVAS